VVIGLGDRADDLDDLALVVCMVGDTRLGRSREAGFLLPAFKSGRVCEGVRMWRTRKSLFPKKSRSWFSPLGELLTVYSMRFLDSRECDVYAPARDARIVGFLPPSRRVAPLRCGNGWSRCRGRSCCPILGDQVSSHSLELPTGMSSPRTGLYGVSRFPGKEGKQPRTASFEQEGERGIEDGDTHRHSENDPNSSIKVI